MFLLRFHFQRVFDSFLRSPDETLSLVCVGKLYRQRMWRNDSMYPLLTLFHHHRRCCLPQGIQREPCDHELGALRTSHAPHNTHHADLAGDGRFQVAEAPAHPNEARHTYR